MRRTTARAWLRAQAALALAAAALVPQAHAQARFDDGQSWLGFEVYTRFGQRVAGEFPSFQGVVEPLPDGRQQVRLRVATSEAVIPDRPRYTAWMRGASFFDTVRHPWMEFVSDPYPADLLRKGGPLHGRLTLRGVTRPQRLEVLPAACARPGLDCGIQVNGSIDRSDFDMRQWQLALADKVWLLASLQLRGPVE